MPWYFYEEISEEYIILNDYRIVRSSQVNGAIIELPFAFVVVPAPVVDVSIYRIAQKKIHKEIYGWNDFVHKHYYTFSCLLFAWKKINYFGLYSFFSTPPIWHFAHFCVKKVTKVIFQPSKNRDFWERGCSSLRMTRERGRKVNLLIVWALGDLEPKNGQGSRYIGEAERGKRPAFRP